MFSKIIFIIKYWLSWCLVFELCRTIFLIANFTETKSAGAANFFGSLWNGLMLDMAVASYITAPVCIFIILSVFLNWFAKKHIYIIYTSVILLLILLITVVDIGVYKAWGYKIDTSPFDYLKYPKEAWASISHIPVVWIFLGILLVWYFCFRFIKKYFAEKLPTLLPIKNKILAASTFLLLTGSLIIPMRGGLQLAPINQSAVYFSKNNFSNLSAVNASFNLLFSIINSNVVKKNPFLYMDMMEAENTIKPYLQNINSADSVKSSLLKENSKPNIILLIWEGFTQKVVSKSVNGIMITPGFNKLKNEGIYFSNIYATGDRTDKGIVAVLSGYPAQSITSIVKIPKKSSQLPMLPHILKSAGYNSLFMYGGEPEFANMKSYLMGGNYDEFITVENFDKKDLNSKWGAHDGVALQKLFEKTQKLPEPFFSNILTISSHEPYEIPVKSRISGNDETSKFLNSMYYTDSVVYRFVEQCKTQAWWKNTILVIIADHGKPVPKTDKKIDDYKIPLLCLGGALKTQGTEIKTLGSQIDISSTLLASLNLDYSKFRFGKNLLDESNKQYAYFAYKNAFGLVQPNGYFIFDNIGKQVFEQNGTVDSSDVKLGKSLEQISFQDFLDK